MTPGSYGNGCMVSIERRLCNLVAYAPRRPSRFVGDATGGRHRFRATRRRPGSLILPAGNRVCFQGRLREAVPDVGDVERIDIARQRTARYPLYAGRTSHRRRWGT